MVDAADAVTARAWSPDGVPASLKSDGSPLTAADLEAEEAMLEVMRREVPDDGFLGEEVGWQPGRDGRRWIVDGIDGTRFFAAGLVTWGTLLALEVDGVIEVGVCSSPLQQRRWWAVRGGGAFAGGADPQSGRRIHVNNELTARADSVACLPTFDALDPRVRRSLSETVGGRVGEWSWSQQCRVAEGELSGCVWFAGDMWDHAAPSLIVEEAGGRFSDHAGGRRLDTRTAVYSNGRCHDALLAAVAVLTP
jgi:histidinol-phosphatase